MSKPQSIKIEPWTSFSKKSYSIFSDDFVHEKLLTVKVNEKPSRGSVNLKQQLVKKGDNFKTSGEIKLWFPIWNSRLGSLYFRSKNNEIKLHYDDGVKGWSNGHFANYNLYGSFQSDKSLKNIVLKAGANLINSNRNLDTRVRVGVSETGEHDVSAGVKYNFTKNNWSFDSYDVFSFQKKALINNAIRVGYSQGDNEFFLRAQNETSRGFKNIDWANLDTYFTRFTADFIRKIDASTKGALEVTIILFRPNSQRTEFPRFQQLSKNQSPKEIAQLK